MKVGGSLGTSRALCHYASMSPEYYRAEAGRVRRLAAEQADLDTARLLLLLAAEYDEVAEQLEAGELHAPREVGLEPG